MFIQQFHVPVNRWVVTPDRGSGLDIARGITVKAVSSLADQGQEQRKIKVFLLTVTSREGVKIIGKIIHDSGDKMKL
jgi:hypothetical protein